MLRLATQASHPRQIERVTQAGCIALLGHQTWEDPFFLHILNKCFCSINPCRMLRLATQASRPRWKNKKTGTQALCMPTRTTHADLGGPLCLHIFKHLFLSLQDARLATQALHPRWKKTGDPSSLNALLGLTILIWEGPSVFTYSNKYLSTTTPTTDP